jgi:hypothetical protein
MGNMIEWASAEIGRRSDKDVGHPAKLCPPSIAFYTNTAVTSG